jgi:hypothetical protein
MTLVGPTSIAGGLASITRRRDNLSDVTTSSNEIMRLTSHSSIRRALLALTLAAAPVAAQTPDSAFYVSRTGTGLLLRLNIDGGFLLGGTWDGGTFGGGIPAEGAGTRWMWYPQKGSFRSGYVNGTQWDDGNIGYFSLAIGENVRASGDHGIALGLRSTAAGSSTFAAGEDNTASGAASVALGYHAHTNARQGSFVFSDRSSVDSLRAGVNHSANWRVSGGFRIFTSSNLSTGVTIQSGATTSNWGQANAAISTSTGAYLSTAGAWINTSDVNRKHLFLEMPGEEVLTRLRSVPIRTWTYRVDGDSVRHIGPTAQDFRRAFGLGSDSVSIATIDADGVSLAAIKSLDARSQRQRSEIAALRKANDSLHRQLVTLSMRMSRLETALATKRRR